MEKFAAAVKDDLLGGKIPSYLLAAGAGALAGGGLTAMQKGKEGETRMARLGRILRNAGLLGLGAGAGTAALGHAAKSFNEALPKGDVSAPEAAADVLGDKNFWSAALPGSRLIHRYVQGAKADNKNLSATVAGARPNMKTDSGHIDYAKFKQNMGNAGAEESKFKGMHPDEAYKKDLMDRSTKAPAEPKGDVKGKEGAKPSKPSAPPSAGGLDADLRNSGLRPDPYEDSTMTKWLKKRYETPQGKWKQGPAGMEPPSPVLHGTPTSTRPKLIGAAEKADKAFRGIGDAVHRHGGRAFGRTVPKQLGAVAELAALGLAPHVASSLSNKLNKEGTPADYE